MSAYDQDETYSITPRIDERKEAEVARIPLSRAGADVTAGQGRWTPLHVASRRGQLEAAHMLIERGADIAARTIDGFTPLHFAADRAEVKVGRMLIERGADMEAQNNAGETSLYMATRKGLLGFSRMLIERGADATCRTKMNGMAPLFSRFAIRRRQELVRMIIERGGDVTVHYYHGLTPLHQASLNGRVEVVRVYFINHGLRM